MKPAEVTISYVVYPPNYVLGVGYFNTTRMTRARSICVRLGKGSTVVRQVMKRNKRGTSWYTPYKSTKLGRIFEEYTYIGN